MFLQFSISVIVHNLDDSLREQTGPTKIMDILYAIGVDASTEFMKRMSSPWVCPANAAHRFVKVKVEML